MSNKSRNQQQRDFLYPSLAEVVIHQATDGDEQASSVEPIYFDPNILCCPYCGNRKVTKADCSKQKKDRYYCQECNIRFIDPKQRENLPKRRYSKQENDKYFDPNTLCCPRCGSVNVKSSGKNAGKNSNGKKRYRCKEPECQRIFIDPKLRERGIPLKEVQCRFCHGKNCVKGGFTGSDGKQKYNCKDCRASFVPGSTRKRRPKNMPLSEDIWDAKALGLKPLKTDSHTKLNFTEISQPWLKELAKKFIKFKSATRAFGTIQNYLVANLDFANFLDSNYPEIINIDQLDRKLVLDYIFYVNSRGLKPSWKNMLIGNLKTFLDTGNENKWFKTNRYLIITEDYSKRSRTLPRYIPPFVLKQLNENLDKLPEPVMRMVLVIQECGMRYSSLGIISFDCLVYIGKDALGNEQWNIKFYDEKLDRERTIPISSELVEIVKQQQEFIREYCGDDNEYLFTARAVGSNGAVFIPMKNQVMSIGNFINYLNNLARKYKIQDENGKLWHFESHQFRHTVGTQMINQGVPQHIIMKILGHCSPEMTMRYAHIHDETLRKELSKFHESKTIDITGQIVAFELESNPEDLEWFTKQIAAIALPNGYCGRPKILGDCDIAGDVGCYICPHFRTNKKFLDIHKDQLERTKKVLTKAYKYDWQLPIKKNEPIRQNLELIITTLEADDR